MNMASIFGCRINRSSASSHTLMLLVFVKMAARRKSLLLNGCQNAVGSYSMYCRRLAPKTLESPPEDDQIGRRLSQADKSGHRNALHSERRRTGRKILARNVRWYAKAYFE